MDSALTTIGLPIALAIIMFGLGLGLTRRRLPPGRRSTRRPWSSRWPASWCCCRRSASASSCSSTSRRCSAIGMLLLAASPGGTSANLFSHLFHGDVALNITLTAVNSVISIVTLPLITNLAIDYYDRGDDVSLPLSRGGPGVRDRAGPGAIGMLVRNRQPGVRRPDGPAGPDRFRGHPRRSWCSASCSTSATTSAATSPTSAWSPRCSARSAWSSGTSCPKAFGVVEDQAIASSMEIGVHNATLAIFVAVEVLDSTEISIPAAVYSIFMFVFAALWGTLLTRRTAARSGAHRLTGTRSTSGRGQRRSHRRRDLAQRPAPVGDRVLVGAPTARPW